MLTVDPNSFTQSDHSTMNAMFERNRTRVREIEAVLGELEPVMSRLIEERSACLSVLQRCAPPMSIWSGDTPTPPDAVQSRSCGTQTSATQDAHGSKH